jgi:DNA invertase Pin-like site-specific DNA recombinase
MPRIQQRAAIYARKSRGTGAQKSVESLQTQIDQCLEAIQDAGHHLAGIFMDVADRNDLRTRPGLNQLRGRMREGAVTLVYVVDHTRLGGTVEQWCDLHDEAARRGCLFRYVHQDDPDERAFLLHALDALALRYRQEDEAGEADTDGR